jgi:hypothetical protein
MFVSQVALGFCNIAQSYRGVKIRQTILGVRAMAGKKIKLDMEDILVAETNSESGVEASDVEDYFEEEEGGGGGTTASLSRSRATGCNKWWITNLGTTSRREHKYSSFCQSSKRCQKE